MELLEAVLLCVLGIASVTFISVGIKVLMSDNNDYRRCRAKTGSWLNPIRGTLSTSHEGNGRDHNVSAGLAFDTKNNRWVEQGRLSEESIDAILG